MEIKATHTKSGRTASVEYNVGKNLDEAVKLFGADVIHHKLQQQIAKDAQALIRSKIEAGKEDDEIQAYFDNEYKPGIGPAKADPVAKLLAAFDKLPADEKKAALQKIKEQRSA